MPLRRPEIEVLAGLLALVVVPLLLTWGFTKILDRWFCRRGVNQSLPKAFMVSNLAVALMLCAIQLTDLPKNDGGLNFFVPYVLEPALVSLPYSLLALFLVHIVNGLWAQLLFGSLAFAAGTAQWAGIIYYFKKKAQARKAEAQ